MRVRAATVDEPPRPGMFSNARRCGDHFVVSGMHAGSDHGPVGGEDVYLQAKEAFRRVIALTEAAGGCADDIMILRVYLTNIDDKVALGRARAEVFNGDFPCSTLVEVSRLADPGLKVEIEAQGIVGAASR